MVGKTRSKKGSYNGRKTFRKKASKKNNHKRGGSVTSSERKRQERKNRVRISAMKDSELFPNVKTLAQVEAKLKTPPKQKIYSPSPRPLTNNINLTYTSQKTLQQKAKLDAEKKRLFDNAPVNIKSLLIKQAARIPLSKEEKGKLDEYKKTQRK